MKINGLFTQSFPGSYALWPWVCIELIMATNGAFFCGTSGLVLGVPNKQAFPEEFRGGTRLEYYASLFNSIEINSSHYKIPQRATFAKWADLAPAGFRFSVKLWQGLTHEPGLHFIPMEVDRFMYAAAGLSSKKGCLLVQLPPRAKADRAGQLERLLERISVAGEGHGNEGYTGEGQWRIAVEFRDRSWYITDTAILLERYGAAGVIQDMPASNLIEPMGNTSFVYKRYHGLDGDYRGGYPDDLLRGEAEKINYWLRDGKDVYVYFNNTIGDAYQNVRSMQGFVLNTLNARSPADGGAG
jgi:uncharacterized protein YecE (DUF72 family)